MGAVAGRGAAASGSAAVVSSVAQAGGRPGPWAISRDFIVLRLNRGRRRDVVWPNIFEHCTGNRVRQTHRSLKRQFRARDSQNLPRRPLLYRLMTRYIGWGSATWEKK